MEDTTLNTPSPVRLDSATKGTWLGRIVGLMTSEAAVPFWLAAILLLGAVLRFIGLNWDDGQHLHPDERFLTMVETAIQWPTSLGQYFNAAASPLSPYNHGYSFYVYGTFPLFLVKRVGMMLNMNGYDQITLVGRALSGVFDLGSIAVLFLVGKRLYGSKVALLGAALLSLAVLDIQQSHFFTVDSYANFFVVLAIYFAVLASEEGHWWHYALFGVAMGAGMASKISVFTLAFVAVLAGVQHFDRIYGRRDGELFDAFERVFVRLVLAGVVSLLTFRVLQPISFGGTSFWDFRLSSNWLSNMAEISAEMSGTADTPPGIQWAFRPIILFPLSNIVVWGLGIPLGLTAWAGWGLGLWELIRRRKLQHLLPVAQVGIVFLYEGTQWVKSMRYFLPIYPFLALLAAYLLVTAWRWAREVRSPLPEGEGHRGSTYSAPGSPAPPRKGGGDGPQSSACGSLEAGADSERGRVKTPRRGVFTVAVAGLIAIVLGGTFLYAIAYTSIYTRTSTRVAASRWIFANIPKGSVLANEHWDDPLPLRLDGIDGFGGLYKGVTMNNYDDDTPTKLNQMVANLSQADYLILSSARLYGSIPRLPMRYPMTTRYYDLLFKEQLGFKKVAEFTSFPQLFGISLPDQSAEEAFTVYDHPVVMIFKKTADFNAARVKSLLSEGIDWARIRQLTPKQATQESARWMAPW